MVISHLRYLGISVFLSLFTKVAEHSDRSSYEVFLRTRRCLKRGMAYWMVWISRLASGLMRWLVPISSPANTHFSTSHRSVLDADRIKDALILGFGWYGNISNVDTPHNAISYFSNMNDHLLINWLTEYHTGQDWGSIEIDTEWKPSSLRTGWQIVFIKRLKHFSNVQHLSEFLKCGHGVGITPKGWPLLFFLLTKGNNFLKLPWDRKTMGSGSPQLLAKKSSSSPLPLKKNIIVITAFWQKSTSWGC